MADLDDVIEDDDVERFRSILYFEVWRSKHHSLTLEPEISGSSRIVPRCKVEQNGAKVSDSEDMVFAEKDHSKTACGNAIDDFKEILERYD